MRADLDLELVREVHPVSAGDDAARERARAALLAAIERTAAGSVPRRNRRRLARARRAWPRPPAGRVSCARASTGT
jgi:hypothetical protein